MIYADSTTEEWTKRYGLSVQPWKCPRCKGDFETKVPVYLADCVGLATPIHECGIDMVKVVLTPRTKAAKEFWGRVVDGAGDQ